MRARAGKAPGRPFAGGRYANSVLEVHSKETGAKLRKIVQKQRQMRTKPRYKQIVGFVRFVPVRQGRAETSNDRTGKFDKGVGYEGWKRSLYHQLWFDSDIERALATILDDPPRGAGQAAAEIASRPRLVRMPESFIPPSEEAPS